MDLVIVESVLDDLVEVVAIDVELIDGGLLDMEEEVIEDDELPDTDDGLPDVGLVVEVEEELSVIDEVVAAIKPLDDGVPPDMIEKLLDAVMLDTVEKPLGMDTTPEEDEALPIIGELLTTTEDVLLVVNRVDEVNELPSSVDGPLGTTVPPDEDILPGVVDDPLERPVPPDEDVLPGMMNEPLTAPDLLDVVKEPVGVPDELLEYGKLPVMVDVPSESYGPLEETASPNWEENGLPALTEELLGMPEPLIEVVVPYVADELSDTGEPPEETALPETLSKVDELAGLFAPVAERELPDGIGLLEDERLIGVPVVLLNPPELPKLLEIDNELLDCTELLGKPRTVAEVESPTTVVVILDVAAPR